MDIKGLVYSILEYKKNKDASQLQLIEIYKKQIKHDLVAAFEMSRDIIRENTTLFLQSPSFLTFLFKLIDNDSSLSFVLTKNSFRSEYEPLKTTPELEQKLDQLEKEYESLKVKETDARTTIRSLERANLSLEKDIEAQKKKTIEQVNDYISKIENFQQEIASLKSQITPPEENSNESQTDVSRLNFEIATYKTKQDVSLQTDPDQEIDKLRRKLDDCLNARSQLLEKASTQSNDNPELHSQIAKLKEKLQECIYARNNELEKLSTQINNNEVLHSQINELNKQLEDSKHNKQLHVPFQQSTTDFNRMVTFIDMLYDFLLRFSGDTPDQNPNKLVYLENKLKVTLDKFQNDYQMLQEWAFSNCNITKENFDVSALVPHLPSLISDVENVCLNRLHYLTNEQIRIRDEHTFMVRMLKENFGEDIFQNAIFYADRIQKIALEVKNYETMKDDLKGIFGKPPTEENFLNQIKKVINFVYEVLNYISKEKHTLPHHFETLREELMADTSTPAIIMPLNDSTETTLPMIMSSADSVETELKSQHVTCENTLDEYKTVIKQLKIEIDQCRETVRSLENKCRLQYENFQKEKEILLQAKEFEIRALQNNSEEAVQLHEKISQLQLQLEGCMTEKNILKKKLQMSEKESIEKNAHVESQNEKLRLLGTKTQELEKENQELKAKLQQISNENANIQENFQRHQQEVQKQFSDKEQKYIAEQETLVTRLNENIAHLRKENENLQQNIHRLNEKIKTQNENLDYDNIEGDLRKDEFPRKRKYAVLSDSDSSIYEHNEDDLKMHLARCIQEKDKITIELSECYEKLQYYEETFKDANYISTSKENDLNMENLKKLFVSFYNYHFQKRAQKIPIEEEDKQVLSSLKTLLENLEKSERNEYNSILYLYLQKQISSLTETEWPAAHLDKVQSIDMLLDSATRETRKFFKYNPVKVELTSHYGNDFNFSNESIVESIKYILECLRDICNTRVVSNMKAFLKQLNAVSSVKYDQWPQKHTTTKEKFIIQVITYCSVESLEIIENVQ